MDVVGGWGLSFSFLFFYFFFFFFCFPRGPPGRGGPVARPPLFFHPPPVLFDMTRNSVLLGSNVFFFFEMTCFDFGNYRRGGFFGGSFSGVLFLLLAVGLRAGLFFTWGLFGGLLFFFTVGLYVLK